MPEPSGLDWTYSIIVEQLIAGLDELGNAGQS
jgi:hypothetical protein